MSKNNFNSFSQKREFLGTLIEISFESDFEDLKVNDIFDECFLEVERIQNKFSRFDEESFLSEVNSNLFNLFEVDDEFLFLFKKFEQINSKSLGYFDIFVKKRLENLGYDKDYSFKKKKIMCLFYKFRSFFVSFFDNKYEVDYKKKKILLRDEVDFGGFGKGYAVDKIVEILQGKKVRNIYVNAGGDIFEGGKSKILLEHPTKEGVVLGNIEIKNQAICSSSGEKRKWKGNHHIINPKTHKSSKGVKGVFVLGNTTLICDAFATAFFAMSFEEAVKISQKVDEVKVLIISSNDKMYKSDGFNCEFYE